MFDVIYTGSVKTILGKEGMSPYLFEYSDRYSVFDWGEMPDLIEGKGKSLAAFAWFFFEFLEKAENWKNWNPGSAWTKNPTYLAFCEKGVTHHGLGLVNAKGEELTRGEFSNYYAVKPIKAIAPKAIEGEGKVDWDYSYYKEPVTDHLVPLEVIFRFGVPEGSSLLKRASNLEYCQSLGLKKSPKAGEIFEEPIVEFSTKLESTDRYIDYQEAAEIAGLSQVELERLVDTSLLLAKRLKDLFFDLGVELWDGKFEYAFGENSKQGRDFYLVDSIGPDELRLVYKGVQLSKERLRKFYRGGSWEENVEKAKKLASERGVVDWKNICTNELKSAPGPLDLQLKKAVEMVYKGLCQRLVHDHYGLEVFKDTWDFDQVAEALK